MTRSIIFALLLALSPAPVIRAVPVPDDEIAAHKVALDLAGAFSNDGFKLRDGNWSGPIKPKDSMLIQVNLYAGNQYWFCAGATDKAKKMAVAVFDETGQPVTTDNYQDGAKAGAGFSPTVSGAYIVRVQELDGAPASFCLLYTYK
ncbi:MAG TPA: hypothetical protein VG733_03435 [Chthoniobacteraceae bacterium]|nr:hypothetical protein [Chthoniobacteraceae bacterium]